MMKALRIVMLAALAVVVPRAWGQQWMSQLPSKAESEQTFQDYLRAFEQYYREHPIDMNKEKLAPRATFVSAEDIQDRVALETYKLFRRWQWLMEPRTYPSGRLDLEAIDAARMSLDADDLHLVESQAAANPLNLKMAAGKLIWPPPGPIWKLLGPTNAVGGTNMGRVNSIQFDPANKNIIYIGAPDGGVWKSTNGGGNWTPLFDAQPTLSVGDVVIDPKNANVLYVATSDPFGYGTPFWGGTYSVGVRKSTNGGSTWAATGLNWTVAQNRTIRRLAIHPTDGNILLAATSAGVFRTTNGGATWSQVLAASAYDAEFQPNDGNIVYVTTTEVLKSTNAGASFTPLTAAACTSGRYSLKIAPSQPATIYTLCANATVQKSTNSGATWTTTPAPGVTLYGYYDTVLAVSPVNPDNVYVAGFNMKQTTNGGTTWSLVNVAGHVDNHCIRFLPGSGTTLLVGNDGGIFKSANSGVTWTSLNSTLAISQFYGLGISKTSPAIMELGAQDNGNMKDSSGAFTSITDADGMLGFIDWSNANVIYASTQYGSLLRSTNGGSTFTNISTQAGGSWVTPWQQDPKVANTIYAATDKVYKSTNQGTNWTAISGTLSGIGTFAVLQVAPSNTQFIYAGSGTVLYRTANGGGSWTNISAGLPLASNYLTGIAVNDTNPEVLYVTFSGYIAQEKVYRSTNGGATWVNISGSLPNMPVDCIVHENKPTNPLYVGTDAGVYYIDDTLSGWIPYKTGLPNVIVDHLQIHYGTKVIRAATYGRGSWEAPLK